MVVACWQRVINEARRAHEGGLAEDVQVFETLLREAADQFDFIIVDEAQSTPSNSYQKIFKHFVNAKRLYLTATVVLEPVRLQARQRPLRVLQVSFLCSLCGFERCVCSGHIVHAHAWLL